MKKVLLVDGMALLFPCFLRNKCLRTIYKTTRWYPYKWDSWLYETFINSYASDRTDTYRYMLGYG